MREDVQLDEIVDINELYKLKSDEYDVLEADQLAVQKHQQSAQAHGQNISAINARIAQLGKEQEVATPTKSTKK